MRNIVAGLFMSLDGVVEAPGQWGFRYMDDEMSRGIAYGISQADTVLLGRKTYLEFAEMWPSQGGDVVMADFLNHSPKYVVSSSLDKLAWGPATLIKGDIAGEITRLKLQPGKTIQVPGSPTLVRWLLSHGLLDELSLTICPVVVGRGMRLFDSNSQQVSLKLVHSTILKSGAIGATYQPDYAGSQAGEPPVSFPEAASRK